MLHIENLIGNLMKQPLQWKYENKITFSITAEKEHGMK